MRRAITAAIVLVLAISLAGVATMAAAQDAQPDAPQNETQPGEALNGALGVTDAQIEGDIAQRGFGISVAQAATNESKAAVVAAQLDDIEQRLQDLEARSAAIEDARADGNLTEGQYNASVATLEAERTTVERLANQSENVSKGLPADVLAEQNVSVEHIQQLRDRADELTGPEVAEIARQIAGPAVDAPLPDEAGDRVPDQPGPPDHAGGDDDEADDVTERPDDDDAQRSEDDTEVDDSDDAAEGADETETDDDDDTDEQSSDQRP